MPRLSNYLCIQHSHDILSLFLYNVCPVCTTPVLCFQLVFRVWDSEYPDNYDEDILKLVPNRNPGKPTILNLAGLSTTIWDTHGLGEVIIRVNATDTDQRVGQDF
ncbi:hypothetical protein DPMN_025830 [Dreissena polymorpha]|uniref:Uncharacterized protein n=1 Tax=Dreissena polymorpha TaxID=45954 RepID=A0A9D4LRF2_DREPO|nr:hypothetical protein DPMN_025830 [Dreissena polymorpha]